MTQYQKYITLGSEKADESAKLTAGDDEAQSSEIYVKRWQNIHATVRDVVKFPDKVEKQKNRSGRNSQIKFAKMTIRW